MLRVGILLIEVNEMLKTLEAVIDENGTVRLLEHLELDGMRRALVTVLESDTERTELRPYGLCVGEFIVPDDFNDPLPETVLALFESL
jgi:hypothetical protein